MRSMRYLKAATAALGGGVLLQAGGCDANAIASDLLSTLAPTLITTLLSSVLGGAGLGF